jgi:hypothetical protein
MVNCRITASQFIVWPNLLVALAPIKFRSPDAHSGRAAVDWVLILLSRSEEHQLPRQQLNFREVHVYCFIIWFAGAPPDT